ncbi:hypothetical protein TNCV_1732361 [Trichonephila clavipes]|nr:hypothetical protein TNCV_1732361 [Trichonephila clavipes]
MARREFLTSCYVLCNLWTLAGVIARAPAPATNEQPWEFELLKYSEFLSNGLLENKWSDTDQVGLKLNTIVTFIFSTVLKDGWFTVPVESSRKLVDGMLQRVVAIM